MKPRFAIFRTRDGLDLPGFNEAETMLGQIETSDMQVPARGASKRATARRWLSGSVVFASLIPIVTILNALVGMLLPQMMEPQAFGEYALVVTLFNYGLIFDFGISQVIDRRIPAYIGSGSPELARQTGDTLLWLRLIIGVVTLAATGIALVLLAGRGILPFGLAAGVLATLAGLADMVALGPACIYRARSDRQDYAILIAALLSGLVIARLGGLAAGGVVGCFAALAVWYVGGAIIFHLRMPLRAYARPGLRESISFLREGIPFFATSFIWAFYVTGNRWIASFLIDPENFGHFAFSANIYSLLVGAAGGFSAFYYPKLTEKIAGTGRYAVSGKLTRDLSGLVMVTAVIVAIGILLAGFLIGLIYPRYVDAVGTARIILVAVPPMVLASWLMPVSLSAGSRPWIDGIFIYPVATVILAVAITTLYRVLGQEGAAWASAAAALPLIAMQLVALCHAKILRSRDALMIFSITLVLSGLLALLAWRMVL